jgi:putative endonuclease
MDLQMPNKNKNIETGKKGEDIAVEYLKGRGYEILRRNFRSGNSEVDIIAKDGNELVFIEVKTRSHHQFGYPEESVDEAKQEAIQSCAEEYISNEGWNGDIRFDIIAITFSESPPIYHMVDAF